MDSFLSMSLVCYAKVFSVEHALNCSKGFFPRNRHNEILDITTTVLAEVRPDVSIKPVLQPCPQLIPGMPQLSQATMQCMFNMFYLTPLYVQIYGVCHFSYGYTVKTIYARIHRHTQNPLLRMHKHTSTHTQVAMHSPHLYITLHTYTHTHTHMHTHAHTHTWDTV